MTADPKKALIVFMRYPEPGKVKSRLAASIGPLEAARVYERLLRKTLGLANEYKRLRPEVEIFLFFTPEEALCQIEDHFSGPWTPIAQTGPHLGAAMHGAVEHALGRGFEHVVLIGTDLIDVEATDFDEAFRALECGFAPLGPAADGGFYLVGLSSSCRQAFAPEQWGGPHIFDRTAALMEKAGLRIRRLKARRDLDRGEDVALLESLPFFKDRLSIIIPTLGPLKGLESLIERLKRHIWPGDEIVIALGENVPTLGPFHEEPSDPVVRIARSPKGRGLQQNCGLRASAGNLLFFLHEDCTPPAHFAYDVRKIGAETRYSLGCFHLAFSPATPALDLIAAWANLRTRLFGLPYGDQGLFCRRETIENAGGFKKPFLMEDVDLARRLSVHGKLLTIAEPIHTSPERYLKRGVLKASLENHLLVLLYYLGVDDKRLYSLYYRKHKSRPLL